MGEGAIQPEIRSRITPLDREYPALRVAAGLDSPDGDVLSAGFCVDFQWRTRSLRDLARHTLWYLAQACRFSFDPIETPPS